MNAIVCSTGMELHEEFGAKKPRKRNGRPNISCAYRFYHDVGMLHYQKAFDRANLRECEEPGDVVDRVLDAVARLFDPAKGGFTSYFQCKLECEIRTARKKQHILQGKFESWTEEIGPTQVDSSVEDNEEKERRIALLNKAMEKLSPIEHEVIRLQLAGLSTDEIARRLGISKINVRVISHRARTKLRIVLWKLMNEG